MSAFLDAARELENLKQRVEQLEALFRSRSRHDGQPPRTHYRASEVAAMIGKKPATVREWIREGRLEAVDMGGWYAVPASAVENLQARRRSA